MDAVTKCLVGIIQSLTNLVNSPEYANVPQPVRREIDTLHEAVPSTWHQAVANNKSLSNYSFYGEGLTGDSPKKKIGGRKSSKKRHTRRNR